MPIKLRVQVSFLIRKNSLKNVLDVQSGMKSKIFWLKTYICRVVFKTCPIKIHLQMIQMIWFQQSVNLSFKNLD